MTTRKGGHFRRGRCPHRPVSAAAPRCHCEERSDAAIRPPSTNPSVKITTIPRRILYTYPKCENFAGNGCESWGSLTGWRGAPQGAPRCFFLGGYAPVGRDPCVPPPGTHFSAGHAGPALRDGMLNRVSGTASPTIFVRDGEGGRSPHLPLKFIRTAQKIYCLFCHNVT